MFELENVIAWAAAFVALWWVIDWLSLRQEGQRMPLRRGPLRILADVLPKLWRNKTFLLALVCLWLIGATVAAVSGYLAVDVAEFGQPLGTVGPRIAEPLSVTDDVPELLAGELPDALPRLLPIPLGGLAAILLVVLLTAGLIRVIIDPPQEIGNEAARKLKWPVGLLCAHIVFYGATVAAGSDYLERLQGPDAPAYAPLLLILPAIWVLDAPVHALLWRLALEIARDGVWSFKSSIASLAESWLPITIAVLVARVLLVPVLLTAVPLWLSVAYVAVPVLLVFVPWTILDRRIGLIAALRRSWWLFRQRPVDLLAFGLRFALMFAVLGGIVALFEPTPGAVPTASWYQPLMGVVRSFLLLLQVMVLARLYAHLAGELEMDEACTGCPGQQSNPEQP